MTMEVKCHKGICKEKNDIPSVEEMFPHDEIEQDLLRQGLEG